jgi:hypothetical protein
MIFTTPVWMKIQAFLRRLYRERPLNEWFINKIKHFFGSFLASTNWRLVIWDFSIWLAL